MSQQGLLVGPVGFEPTTYGLKGRCSGSCGLSRTAAASDWA